MPQRLSSPTSIKPMALDLNNPPPDEREVLPDLNEQQAEDEADHLQIHDAHQDELLGVDIAGGQSQIISTGTCLLTYRSLLEYSNLTPLTCSWLTPPTRWGRRCPTRPQQAAGSRWRRSTPDAWCTSSWSCSSWDYWRQKPNNQPRYLSLHLSSYWSQTHTTHLLFMNTT